MNKRFKKALRSGAMKYSRKKLTRQNSRAHGHSYQHILDEQRAEETCVTHLHHNPLHPRAGLTVASLVSTKMPDN